MLSAVNSNGTSNLTSQSSLVTLAEPQSSSTSTLHSRLEAIRPVSSSQRVKQASLIDLTNTLNFAIDNGKLFLSSFDENFYSLEDISNQLHTLVFANSPRLVRPHVDEICDIALQSILSEAPARDICQNIAQIVHDDQSRNKSSQIPDTPLGQIRELELVFRQNDITLETQHTPSAEALSKILNILKNAIARVKDGSSFNNKKYDQLLLANMRNCRLPLPFNVDEKSSESSMFAQRTEQRNKIALIYLDAIKQVLQQLGFDNCTNA